MDYNQKALILHEENRGKITVQSKVPVKNRDDLSIAYTPGVAEPCKQINKYPDDVYRYTSRGNMVAVVSDGTAVLGLGDISLVQCRLWKVRLFVQKLCRCRCIPICLDTRSG